MIISAKVICDSIGSNGIRITSLELEYPRFILAELNTHRVFSRSTASSRAIPVAKLLERVRTDPAMPVHWGANQPGMQATKEVTDIHSAKQMWHFASKAAAGFAEEMVKLGVHKQVANRILEPFVNARTIVTSTEWDNFFRLRLHPDAQPEMRELARAMKEAIDASNPVRQSEHLPYVSDEEAINECERYRDAAKLSAARCARVSYDNHGAGNDPEKDKDLADRLISAGHMSPFEHQAVDTGGNRFFRNFRGWRQFRADIERE